MKKIPVKIRLEDKTCQRFKRFNKKDTGEVSLTWMWI